MHAATRAGSVLFAPPPCAKGTATVKFFTMDNIYIYIKNSEKLNKLEGDFFGEGALSDETLNLTSEQQGENQ